MSVMFQTDETVSREVAAMVERAKTNAGKLASLLAASETDSRYSGGSLEFYSMLTAEFRERFRELRTEVESLYVTLPDGVVIFGPDLLALRDIAHSLSLDIEKVRGRSWIENGRVTALELSETALKDLSPLAALTGLNDLMLPKCEHITSVAALASLTHLRHLNLYKCPGIADISAISRLQNLQMLFIVGTSVVDIKPLEGLRNLQHLHLPGLAELSQNAAVIERLRSGGCVVSFD